MKPQIFDKFNHNKQILHQLMQYAQIDNLETLSKLSGISSWQLNRLQFGLMPKLTVENLVKLSATLEIPVDKCLSLFYHNMPHLPCVEMIESSANLEELNRVKQEYELLQQQLKQQKDTLVDAEELNRVRQEYELLQQQLKQQKDTLKQEYKLLQQQLEQQKDTLVDVEELNRVKQEYELLQQQLEQQKDTLVNVEEFNRVKQEYKLLQQQLEQQKDTLVDVEELNRVRQEYELLQQQLEQQKDTLVDVEELNRVKQEYELLQQQLEQQKDTLKQEFQQSSLEVLESWLLQWPTAAAAAQKNPQLSAMKLLVLVKPVVELLKRWGVENIGLVGEKIPYNPQCHQLLEGNAVAGDLVEVRYVGYRQDDRLLYRAKVSPIMSDNGNR